MAPPLTAEARSRNYNYYVGTALLMAVVTSWVGVSSVPTPLSLPFLPW